GRGAGRGAGREGVFCGRRAGRRAGGASRSACTAAGRVRGRAAGRPGRSGRLPAGAAPGGCPASYRHRSGLRAAGAPRPRFRRAGASHRGAEAVRAGLAARRPGPSGRALWRRRLPPGHLRAMMGPALLALWAALLPLREPGPLSPRIASYRIKVKLDASAHTLDGEETLLWRNDAGAPTRELWFHLYMNAFKNQTTAMLSPLGQGPGSSGLPSEKWGAVDVGSLRCDGHLLALELREDGTVGRVALPREVAPGQIVRCEIAWHTQLPQLVARAGFQGDFHMVAQWFPKIGVWDGRAWKCHVYCATCEFFADFGVYDVEITVPEKFVVGASGVLVSQSASAQTRTYVYHAEDVHDFAWAASPDFRERTKSFDAAPGLPPVTVRLLYQPDHAWFADEHLRLLGATLRDYGDWF